MRSLGDISKTLNRTAVYVGGLHTRFELPVIEIAANSTERAILEFCEVLTEAIQTGRPHQIHLNLPAAESRCCCPPRMRNYER